MGRPAGEWPSKRWLIAVVLIGIALRIIGLDAKPLWEDEAWTFYTITAPEGVVSISGLDPHPLSFFTFYKALPDWCLKTDWRFRLPSAVFSSVALLLMVRFLSLLGVDGVTRFWSLVLFAVLPLNIRYSYEARAYALAEMLAVAVLVAYLSAHARPSRTRFAILMAAVGLSAHLDGFGLAAPFACFVHALLTWKRMPASKNLAICIAAGTLLASPYYAYRAYLIATADGMHQIDPTGSLLISLGGRLAELSPVGLSFEQMPSGMKWPIYVLAVATVLVPFVGLRRKAGNPNILLIWLLFLLTPAAYSTISATLGINVIHKKYLIVIVPAFVPLITIGVLHLFRRARVPVALLLFAVPLSVSVLMIRTPGDRADWKTLAAHMQPQLRPSDLFIQEQQANYPLYSFTSLGAYTYRHGMLLQSGQLKEYKPATRQRNAAVPLHDPGAWRTEQERLVILELIRTAGTDRVWTITTDWMARGRMLDLSAIAAPVFEAKAAGVRAILWRIGGGL